MGRDDFEKKATYDFRLAYSVLNRGPSELKSVKISLLRLPSYEPYTRAEIKSITPDYTVEENSFKCETINFHTPSIPPKQTVNLTLHYTVEVTPQKFNVDPNKVGEYNRRDINYIKYMRESPQIESKHPEIRAAAQRAAAGEENPYRRALNIFRFVGKHVNYKKMPTRGALYALKNRQGDCAEFSRLFVALCRASGIPARLIRGYSHYDPQKNRKKPDAERHAWAEFLIPNYGWLPADPTWGRHEGRYFAEMDNDHIVSFVEGKYTLSAAGLDIVWAAGSGDPNQLDAVETISINPI